MYIAMLSGSVPGARFVATMPASDRPSDSSISWPSLRRHKASSHEAVTSRLRRRQARIVLPLERDPAPLGPPPRQREAMRSGRSAWRGGS